MITKEQILNDPDVPINYVDKERNWVNEAFLDGIDYAERKPTTQKMFGMFGR